jgi:hypothetical protein
MPEWGIRSVTRKPEVATKGKSTMVRSHVLRALRLPLLLLAILALVWLGLSTAEGTSSHPQGLNAQTVSSQSNTKGDDKGDAKGDKDKDKKCGDGDNDGDDNCPPPKHCKDHHGHDDEHNKHCRPISDD